MGFDLTVCIFDGRFLRRREFVAILVSRSFNKELFLLFPDLDNGNIAPPQVFMFYEPREFPAVPYLSRVVIAE